MNSRVVITGIGIVSPIGLSKPEFWESCLAGRSGVVRLDGHWISQTDLSTRIGAVVRHYEPSRTGIAPRQAQLLDRTTLFALGAAHEALADAGFDLEPDPDRRGALRVRDVEPSRIATAIGSGIGGLRTLEATHALWRESRSKKGIKRYALPMLIPNAPAGQAAIRFGARGECRAISTACAAGTMALGDGWRMLRAGEADLVIAGGTEGVTGDEDGYALMGFDRLQALSRRNDEPERASRPFDRQRDGFVLGEGAGVLVLEREQDAAARGAKPYAAVAGYASNCDALSMLQLDESGRSIVDLMRSALRASGLTGEEVDCVNAHGTSTLINDRTEAKALRLLFGAHCGDLWVTALKSMTGHAIAGSGPMETAAAALSLRHGVVTPTINYEFPDPECDVRVVANRPQPHQGEVTMKLSYGFGGHNACLVLTRP